MTTETKRTKDDELFAIASTAEHVARGLHVLAMFACVEDQDPRIAALLAGIEALRSQAELLEGEAFKAWNDAQVVTPRAMPSSRTH